MVFVYVIFGVIVALVLLGASLIAGLSTAVCWVFAVCFWLGLISLVGGFLLGIIVSLIAWDFDYFKSIAGGGAALCGFLLLLALFAFIAAIFIGLMHSIASIFNLTDVPAIEYRHFIFPWERCA